MASLPLRLVTTPAGELPDSVAAPAEVVKHPAARHEPADEAPARAPSPFAEKLRALAAAVLPTMFLLLLLLGFWEIACQGAGADLPAPSGIWEESREVILHPLKGVTYSADAGLAVEGGADVGLLVHIATSLGRVAMGYSLSAILGIALGVLVGQSVVAYRALDPIFQVLRTVPPLAWLPISLAIFQQAGPSAVFLIFITAIWPVILNTAAGVQAIPQNYRNVARVLQLGPATYFFKIVLPATVPYMFTGLRIGIGMSWLAIVAAEMVQGGTGIGFFIWDSYNSSLLSDTIVALVHIGIVGFALDRLVALIGRRVARQA